YVGIPGRIPSLGIDAVQDADEIAGTPGDDTVEPEPELGPHDLFRVPWADGRDLLAEVDPALQVADVPPELHRLDVEHLPAQPDLRQDRRREQALERVVVDREHGGHAADDRVARVVHLLVDGHQAGLPVVRVNDRRPYAL